MKRFTIPCDFGGKKAPFHVYIGEPKPGHHPLQHQANWLSTERGGTIPQDIMDSFQKLYDISQKNNVSFEDLCVYALGTAQEKKKAEEAAKSGAPAGTAGATGAATASGGGAAAGGKAGMSGLAGGLGGMMGGLSNLKSAIAKGQSPEAQKAATELAKAHDKEDFKETMDEIKNPLAEDGSSSASSSSAETQQKAQKEITEKLPKSTSPFAFANSPFLKPKADYGEQDKNKDKGKAAKPTSDSKEKNQSEDDKS